MLRPATMLWFLGACRPDAPSVQVTPIEQDADAAPALAPAPAPPDAATFVPPRLALVDSTTEGPKGDLPSLRIEPVGLPALSADERTYAWVDELDYYGHTVETSLTLLDVKTGKPTRTVLARVADQIPGSMGAGSYPPARRAALAAKLAKVNEALGHVTWTEPGIEPFYAQRANSSAPSADWEIVRKLPDLEVLARWDASGKVERVRVQGSSTFEGLPAWSKAKAPECGYEGVKRVPDETIAVTAVSPHVIVLAREWLLGTHDCDGIRGASSVAFVPR